MLSTPRRVVVKRKAEMACKILSFPGSCFQMPKLMYQICCVFYGERNPRVTEENTRGRKVILPVSRDGEGNVEKVTLGLRGSGAPPWQCPGLSAGNDYRSPK